MEEQTPEKLNQENKEETVLLPQNEENNKMSCISISGFIFQIIILIGVICLLYIYTYREKRDSFSGRKSLSIGFIIALNFECLFYIIYVWILWYDDRNFVKFFQDKGEIQYIKAKPPWIC